jgi:hypothetical protein
MTCVNCSKPALWVWVSNYTDDLAYCEGHLPRFLYPLRKAGLLQTTEEYAKISAELAEVLAPVDVPAPAARKKRAPKSTVNVEPVEEESDVVDDESNQDPS